MNDKLNQSKSQMEKAVQHLQTEFSKLRVGRATTSMVDGVRIEVYGSGMTLKEVAQELSRRHARLFLPDENGARPIHGEDARYATNPHWNHLALFYEYFHADTGRGCGASHQTGWTALIVRLLKGADGDRRT